MISGATLGADDGTIARIEYDNYPLRTIFVFLASPWVQLYFGRISTIVFVMCFAYLVLLRKVKLALGLSIFGGMTYGLISALSTRNSTVYVGSGTLGEFFASLIGGGLYISVVYFLLLGVVATVLLGMVWATYFLVNRSLTKRKET